MKKKEKIELAFLFGGAPFLVGKGYFLVRNEISDNYLDSTDENTIGYENIGIRYNTKVHPNNFVLLHLSSNGNDLSYLQKQLEKCNELDISVGLVLDTDASTLGSIYKDIDFIQSLLLTYKIDLPIFLNIDGIMNNKSLNNIQKNSLIEAFINKANASNLYIGMSGSDMSLSLCEEYICSLKDFDCYLIKDNSSYDYSGTASIVKELDGTIKSSIDLAKVITEKGLNSKEKLVLSAKYIAKEDDTYNTLALEFGLSEEDLRLYNNNSKGELKVGDIVSIPNLYQSIDTKTNEVSYMYAIARGIDISDYQVNIDWNRVAETSDFVIVEVARDNYNYKENPGYFIPECINQITNTINNDISLGLYFCVSKDMDISEYEKRLINYFDRLMDELDNSITLEKENIPVFLDFEVYCSDNDYYGLLNTFKNVCNSYGFTKVGIYGNKNTLTQISSSLKKDGERIELKDTDFFVWQAGGVQYSGREHTNLDDVKVEDLIETQNFVGEQYETSIMQVTNVATNTGASNNMGHCDVDYLYDSNVFGDDFKDNSYHNINDQIETIEIDIDKYRSIPYHQILLYFDTILSACYAILAVKVIGKKICISMLNKAKEKGYIKTKVKDDNV